MIEIKFYTDADGMNPIEDFIDSLESKQAQKVIWVLQLIEEQERIPKTYFKLLVNTDGIWEVRIQFGNNIFRLLGFMSKGKLVVLTNGFVKKTQKTPKKEIHLAEKRKIDWLRRNNE